MVNVADPLEYGGPTFLTVWWTHMRGKRKLRIAQQATGVGQLTENKIFLKELRQFFIYLFIYFIHLSYLRLVQS